MGKGKPKTKGKKIQLGDFIGETGLRSDNYPFFTFLEGNKIAVNGEMMELPSAPRATTLEIDASKVSQKPKLFSAEL